MAEKAKGVLDGFQRFIMRGNVVDLAVGIIIGASFTAVVNSLVRDIITPFIAAIGSQPDFSKLAFQIRGSTFMYGDFLNTLISFIIQASIVYFAIVLPINALRESMQKASVPADPTSKKCPQCKSEIPIDATRCAHCTQPV